MEIVFIIGIIEFVAILTFAYTGLVKAKEKDMDFVGAFALALATAFGGGTVRDVLLNLRPLYWVEHYYYTITVFILTGITVFLFRFEKDVFNSKFINTIDALGLGLFSATGVAIALKNDLPLFPASLIGVITAVAGGIIRDVLCGEIPMIFRRVRLYVTCSFAGIWIYILLNLAGVAEIVCLISCIIVTFVLRITALRFNLRLPL